jgi:phytoene dehydrogenase-like protein
MGVTLANGDQIAASKIISAADMRTTFLKLVDEKHLDKMFLKQVQNIQYRGTMARVHFTLNGLPTFTGVNGNSQQFLGGHIQIAPSLNFIEKAYDPVKYGEYTEQPYLDIHIPTLTDSSLAPEGKHIMSVTVKYMPYHLGQGDWNKIRDKVLDLVTRNLTKYAPDFPQKIEQSQVITPLDMETIYNLPEGNPVHGDMTLGKFLWMRPLPGYSQYSSPVDGLYLCSAATHPGGGVTGMNGKNAARVIIKKRK